MKTFIDSLIVQIATITHPAGGWFKMTATGKKRGNENMTPAVMLSPDCFAVRGGSSKKTSTRRTPAP